MPSAIGWTDETWNPTVGCSRISTGCDRCYAITVAGRAMQPAHVGLTIRRPGERLDWTGEVRTLDDRLEIPLRWTRPRRVFVDSMSDLFHDDVPVEFIGRVIDTMARCPRHTFQVLTKRAQRMAHVLDERLATPDEVSDGYELGIVPGLLYDRPLPHVWWGVSIESNRYRFRADHLRRVPGNRFLSLEPLVGPLPDLDLTGIGWVIVGGESGPGARRVDLEWIGDIIETCRAQSVPLFVKQLGSGWAKAHDARSSKGTDPTEWPAEFRVQEFPGG